MKNLLNILIVDILIVILVLAAHASSVTFSDTWANSKGIDVTDGGLWTRQVVASGSINISSSIVAAGDNYSLHCTASSASNGGSAYVEKDFATALQTAYASCKVYFVSFGDPVWTNNGSAQMTRFLRLRGSQEGNAIACAAITLVDGVPEWCLHYRDGNQIFHCIPAASHLPKLDTWYTVTAGGFVDSTHGWSALWVNGAKLIQETNLNNSAIGEVNALQVGIPTANVNLQQAEVYIDNAQFSTTSLITTAPISLPIIIIIIVVIAVAAVAIVWVRKHAYSRRKSQS